MRLMWDQSDLTYMRAAYFQAVNSPDVSTQNGAVLVSWDGSLVFGYNSPPLGINHSYDRLTGESKYDWIVHAEHSVILHSASQGISTFGATLYAPWIACIRCAVSLIQAGISRVVGHRAYADFASAVNSKWDSSVEEGIAALEEGGVSVQWVEGRILGAPPLMVGGRLFDPSL
jgi:dCMP deaminase